MSDNNQGKKCSDYETSKSVADKGSNNVTISVSDKDKASEMK